MTSYIVTIELLFLSIWFKYAIKYADKFKI